MLLPETRPALLAALLLLPATALAQDLCGTGVGETCPCADNTYATACVEGSPDTCQVPCADAFGDPDPGLCVPGEACVPGTLDGDAGYYCKLGTFSMDLSLLDMCVSYFIDGIQPGGDSCTLEGAFTSMLDQDGDGIFDIFDVDGCIRSFAGRPACVDAPTCDGIYCTSHEDCGGSAPDSEHPDGTCGGGLHCNLELHRCERECGLVGNRESAGVTYLDRPCFGSLQTCNTTCGKCVDVTLDGLTCQIDAQCPKGSYCFLGQCTAECWRNVDCPAGNWYCNPHNRCASLPGVGDSGGFVFEPEAYSIHFTSRQVEVTEVNDAYDIPLVIIDLHSRREVHGNAAVSFGYRTQLTFLPIQNARCDELLSLESPDEEQQLAIDACENPPEFLALTQPFGTLTADEWPVVSVEMDPEITRNLEPGTYQAKLEAVFTNGGSSSTSLLFHKQSLSGQYSGQVSVYLDQPENSFLGNTHVQLSVHVFDGEGASIIRWNGNTTNPGLAEREGLGSQDIVDITEGYEVHAVIDGNSAAIFDNPSATTKNANKIGLKGIYSPDLGRMHLVGVIDLPWNHCRTEVGSCNAGSTHDLSIRNFFGRDIRRVIHFIGPYDAKQRRFHGIYRETIQGLGTADITFDGGFILNQVRSGQGPDPSDPALQSPMVKTPAPGFPTAQDLAAEIMSGTPAVPESPVVYPEERWSICGTLTGDEHPENDFSTEAAFRAYMSGLGDEQDPPSPILANMVHLEDEIRWALDALEEDSEERLTIFEYLQGTIFLCSERPGDANCIDENQARCGLMLERRAIVEGWASDLGYGTPLPAGDELFCGPGSQLPGCNADVNARGQLKVLQEHNRFYTALSQALRYQAASDISEAFYLLYRKANEPIEQAQAMSEKYDKLLAAWGRYDELLRLTFSPVSTRIMLDWPMASFKGKGAVWIDQTQAVLGDRLDALRELVDLKRRMFAASDNQDYLFVQDLLHQEYLVQAFMLHLQNQWQGDSFYYAGHGPEALAEGQRILNQINDNRNPLGYHPNQIFFENSDLTATNWRNYLNQIRQGGLSGQGLLGDTKALVNQAITEMRGALASKQTFEGQLLTSRHGYEDRMDQICGPCIRNDDGSGCPEGSPSELPSAETQCSGTSAEEQEAASADCHGPECPYEYTCDGKPCDDVVLGRFVSETENAATDAACRIETPDYSIQIGSVERKCVRGQIGALLQERATLSVQMRSLMRQMQSLAKRVDKLSTEYSTTQDNNADLEDYIRKRQYALHGLSAALNTADALFALLSSTAETTMCTFIVGLANGGNCITAPVRAAIYSPANVVYHATKIVAEQVMAELQYQIQDKTMETSHDATERSLHLQLQNTMLETENLIGQYEVIVQQRVNLEMRINDNLYLAQQASNHYQQSISMLVDHLLGTEQGSVLRSNYAVQQANAKFAELLRVTYKMAAAFIHAYNMEGYANQIYARVFEIVTTDGIDQFVLYLEGLERDYCGASGIDCDAVNNASTLRFSMRDALLGPGPDLTQDSDNMKVLTRGEMFHNLITSSMFRKKKVRGPLTVEQIEIPFDIPLNDRAGFDDPSLRWLVSPLECNHIVVGRGNGTVGVNVIGTRLGTLRYEIERRNVDSIRGCDMESTIPPGGGMPILDYPIARFVVGYAPQHVLAQEDEPPEFVTRSGFQTACRNRRENSQAYVEDESCYRYFARDRSLGGTWRLVIPIDLEGNGWIMGDGLSEEERPIIEDVVLYFRYRSRPTDY